MTLIILYSGMCYSYSKDENPIYTYDMTNIYKLDRAVESNTQRIWDELHFVSSLQGLANRDSAHLYIYLVGEENGRIDHFWFNKLREPGNWLNNKTVKSIPDLKTLVNTFKSSIKGLVVYDGNVPATSNAASTIAGAENLACIRYDKHKGSLYRWLTDDPDGPKLPVKVWLVRRNGTSIFTGKGIIHGTNIKSTGSAKCDVYIWAKNKYLDKGKCNPSKMGYYLDAYWLKTSWGYIPQNSLPNHDFFISNKAFFFDLSPWDDEAPNDDPNQPIGTDTKTLKSILLSAYKQNEGKSMIHIGGYVPWERKYSNFNNVNGKHEVVAGEWKYAEIISCYNAFMDADAFAYNPMANASFFQHFPKEKVYKQNRPTIDTLKQKGYIDEDGKVTSKVFASIYMGDYDSAAWMYNTLPGIWNDASRGTIPLSWGFNPNHTERFSPGLQYTRETATANDLFVAGDSGAGYLNPGYLVEPRKHSGLPSGLDVWADHCSRWYKQWDITATGFIIDGNAPGMNDKVLEAYSRFSPDGISPQKISHFGLYNDMPWIQTDYLLNIGEKPESMAPVVIERCSQQKPDFMIFRSVLWSPSNVKRLMELVKSDEWCKDVEFVDIYTLMLLAKQYHLKGQKSIAFKSDLWDIKSGVEVIAHSDINYPCDIRDIFGGRYGTYETDTVLFADGKNSPYTHWVEWKTVDSIKLKSLRLYAAGDAETSQSGARMREFDEFRLYAKTSPDSEWELVTSYKPEHPYKHEIGAPLLRLKTIILNDVVNAQYFRAEFDQCEEGKSQGWGPRIIELDGFDK